MTTEPPEDHRADGAASRPARRRSALAGATLGVASLLLLTRLPVLLAYAPDRLFNADELELTFAMLGRFLGLPSTVLIWPAGPLQMLAVPLFSADFLVACGFAPSPLKLAGYMGSMYRAPWHALALIRLTVAVVSSLGFATLYGPFSRLLESRAAGLLAVLALATAPAMWIHSHVGMLDAFAFGFAAAGIAVLLREDAAGPRLSIGPAIELVTAGALAGLAVASKVTVVPLLPFVLGLAVQRSALTWWRSLVLAGAGLAIGFGLGCPYLWTDPVRLAKNVVGNAARPGAASGLAAALSTSLQVIPLPLWILAFAGLYVAVRRRSFALVAGSVATVALSIAIVARGGVVFPRYLLPILPVAAVLTVLALRELRSPQRAAGRAPIPAGVVAPALLGLVVTVNVALYAVEVPAAFGEMRFVSAAAAGVRALAPGSSVAVPWTLFRHVASEASSESVRRLGEAAGARLIEKDAIAEFSARAGVPKPAVLALPRLFDEEEQTFAAEAAVMSSPFAWPGRPGLDVRVYTKPELAPRFGFLTSGEALGLFREGRVNALVLAEVPAGMTPAETYDGRLFLFLRDGGGEAPR